MLDYCCYGAMISRWYVGRQAVADIGMGANLNSHWGDADDNGAMLVRFPEAMALLEGSWTTFDRSVAGGPLVYGTEGTMVVSEKEGTIRVERGGGRSESFPCDPLPEGRTQIAEEYVHHLDTGEPLHPTLEMHFNLEAMAILDAGVRSAVTGRLEIVNNRNWPS